MTNNLYHRLYSSFNTMEEKDFKATCRIIDHFPGLKAKVVLIMDDPYLLVLAFTALLRYYGIEIHIINSNENPSEILNQLMLINPDTIITTPTSKELFFHSRFGFKKKTLTLTGILLSNEYHEIDEVPSPDAIDFKIYTYTPYPVKIRAISSGIFTTMVYAVVQDLLKFNLVDHKATGLFPFATTNSDYLLHFIAVKLAHNLTDYPISLPSNPGDIEFIVKGDYNQFNNCKTLFIPKKEFISLMEENVTSIFERRFIFKSYLKRKWLVNILLRRKIKKLLGRFKSVLIIGTIEDSYLIEILKNISFIKFYTMFPVKNAMMFGPISHSLDSITLSNNEYRQDIPHKSIESTVSNGTTIYSLSFRLNNHVDEETYTLTDTTDRFTDDYFIDDNGENRRKLFLLGNYENSFVKDNTLIFPETLEKVINSYPFIRNCALLTFSKKLVLVVNPNMDVLDANRINYTMFSDIMYKQIHILNRELPDSYKIQGLVISSSLIEQDRIGEIVRFTFNYCNKNEVVSA